MVGTHPYFRPTLSDYGGANLSTLLSDPVLPSVSGMSFLKVLAVGAGLVYILGGFSKAIRGIHK
jgi:hypothetical protein